MHSSFAVKTQPHVMYQIYTWQLILPPTSSFGEICADSNLVTVLPYEWSFWEELLAACPFGKNWTIITKYYKSREVSFLHLFAVQAPREEGGNPSGSTQVWMVERHVYKSYNTNPNLWIFSNDNDSYQMTEEEGEEGKMSLSEALVSFSNFIHWPFFLC